MHHRLFLLYFIAICVCNTCLQLLCYDNATIKNSVLTQNYYMEAQIFGHFIEFQELGLRYYCPKVFQKNVP